MSFWTDVAGDGVAAWFDTDGLGRSAIYTAAGEGAGTACTVIIRYGGQPEVGRSPVNLGPGVRYLPDEAVLVAAVAEVANPRAGDAFVVLGRTWTVREVLWGNGVHWRLRAAAQVRVSH